MIYYILYMEERYKALQQLFFNCSRFYGIYEIQKMPYNAEDRGSNNTNEYTMCYHRKNSTMKATCGPDWVTHSWPSANITSFADTVKQTIEKSKEAPIINKVGWYGNIYSPAKDVIESQTRPLLKKIGDENKDIFDIIHVDGNKISSKNTNYLSIPDLTKYSVLIDIGGNGYSGRLKYLLFSGRPLIIVERNYIEYFHDDLIPYVHFIPVKMDLSDLLEKTEWVFANYDKCKKMADNAFEFGLQYFSRDNINKRIYDVYLELKSHNTNNSYATPSNSFDKFVSYLA